MRLSRAAGFSGTREQSLLGSDRREADLLIANWEGVQSLAVDLTVLHQRAQGTSFSDPDRLLLRAEEEKRQMASTRAQLSGCLFEPLVFHKWSGVPNAGSSRSFLGRWIARIVENRPGLDKERKANELLEGLSCILFAQIAE